MDRLSRSGVIYPEGYEAELIRKYKKEGVRYPRILQRIGEPNIRKHPQYRKILQMRGTLLDYGCGTGDDIRVLVDDGYPGSQIVGYDVNWDSINLGFDFYLDPERLKVQFVVDRQFPFPPPNFDLIYSGSVLHVLVTKRAIRKYLTNVFATLTDCGTFFGSTLNFGQGIPKNISKKPIPIEWRRRRWHWLRWLARWITFLSKEGLQKAFEETGFVEIEITLDASYRRLWFYAKKP